MSSKWELLEEWILDIDITRFTVFDIAEAFEIEVPEASGLIQGYLRAQRQDGSNTLYVLKREGRTRSAVWSVGQRQMDARIIGGTLFEDVAVKVRRAFAPDLRRLAAKNPKAAKYAEQKIVSVVDG